VEEVVMEYLFLPRVEQGLASFAIGQPMLEHLMHCKKTIMDLDPVQDMDPTISEDPYH
jgi:hypothetical protein